MSALLANPLFFGLLGAGVGTGMLLISHATAKTMTADDPSLGFARVAMSMVFRLLVVLVSLFAFYMWNRPMLAPFGIGLIAGFMVMIGVELYMLGVRSDPSVR